MINDAPFDVAITINVRITFLLRIFMIPHEPYEMAPSTLVEYAIMAEIAGHAR